jgi:hypothetical protein
MGGRFIIPNFSIVLIYFFSLLLILNFSLKVPYEEKKREKYYTKILEESIPNSGKELELKYDEQGFYLTNINEISTDKKLLAFINKKHVISGCEFFPFRDYITGLIVQYANKNYSFNREVAIPLFTTVYYMLYLRFGDKERAYNFYSRKLKQKQRSEFYNFELNSDLKEFMLHMPLEKGNTPFYYSDEDLDLARKLGVSMTTYDLAIGMFEYVHKGVKMLRDELYRESMMPIVNNKEHFKKYTDYVFRKGVHVRVREYQNIYPLEVAEEYDQYHTIFRDKFKYKNEICYVLFPLVDLLRNYDDPKLSSNVNLNLRTEVGFGLAMMDKFPKNSILGFKIDEMNRILTNENIYVDHGVYNLNKTSKGVSLPYKFNRNDFSLKKGQVCNSIGCGNFDIELFWMLNTTAMEHSFIINEDISYPILNIFKLIHMDDNKINEHILPAKLQTFTKFDSELEIKALNSYFQVLREADEKTLNYVIFIIIL